MKRTDSKNVTKIRTNITVTKKYKDQFDEIAENEKLKFSTVLDELLRDWLKKKKKEIKQEESI